jgi:hypothetical protein
MPPRFSFNTGSGAFKPLKDPLGVMQEVANNRRFGGDHMTFSKSLRTVLIYQKPSVSLFF